MQQGTSHLPMIPVERMDDLHHLDIVESADLVLFMAGNQFMVMPEMVQAFQDTYPDIRRIFYETLPPGLELKQTEQRRGVWGQDFVLPT